MELFDVENHSLTEEALKTSIFSIKPYAHSMTDADIFRIAQERNRGIEEIVELVKDTRFAERNLIDAALTHREPQFSNSMFRVKDNMGITPQEFMESAIIQLNESYPLLSPKGGDHPTSMLVQKLLTDAYRWSEQQKARGKSDHPR